jgi:hypothetical protein
MFKKDTYICTNKSFTFSARLPPLVDTVAGNTSVAGQTYKNANLARMRPCAPSSATTKILVGTMPVPERGGHVTTSDVGDVMVAGTPRVDSLKRTATVPAATPNSVPAGTDITIFVL